MPFGTLRKGYGPKRIDCAAHHHVIFDTFIVGGLMPASRLSSWAPRERNESELPFEVLTDLGRPAGGCSLRRACARWLRLRPRKISV